MREAEIHKLRHELTKVNKTLLQARAYATQPSVLELIDRAVIEICSIGDGLSSNKKERL